MPRCLQQNSQQMVLLMAGRRVTRDLEAVTTHLSADLQLPKHPLMKTITVFHHRNVRYQICPIAMKTNAVLIILISIVFNMQSPPPGENCQGFHNCHVFLQQHPRYHHLPNRSSSNVPDIASTLGHPRNYLISRISPSTL